MGLTAVLVLVTATLFALTVYFAVGEIREKKWKKAALAAIAFAAFTALLYFGLLSFITSM